MTLAELIGKIDNFDDKLTIYAEKNPIWTINSQAIICAQSEDGQIIDEPTDLRYFLEIDVAKEVIQVWSEWSGRKPTIEDKCAAIIYYAEYDAYMECT